MARQVGAGQRARKPGIGRGEGLRRRRQTSGTPVTASGARIGTAGAAALIEETIARLADTWEAREGISAFPERREPAWRAPAGAVADQMCGRPPP
jgi:hypothetical protein